MVVHRLPRILLYGKLFTAHSKEVFPGNDTDSHKRSPTLCGIDHRQLATHAADCDSWRRTVHQTTTQFEDSRRGGAAEKKAPTPEQYPASTSPRPDLLMRWLWQIMPVSHRSRQSSACLQLTSSFAKPSHDADEFQRFASRFCPVSVHGFTCQLGNESKTIDYERSM